MSLALFNRNCTISIAGILPFRPRSMNIHVAPAAASSPRLLRQQPWNVDRRIFTGKKQTTHRDSPRHTDLNVGSHESLTSSSQHEDPALRRLGIISTADLSRIHEASVSEGPPNNVMDKNGTRLWVVSDRSAGRMSHLGRQLIKYALGGLLEMQLPRPRVPSALLTALPVCFTATKSSCGVEEACPRDLAR